MNILMQIRETIRGFYARFEVYITPVLKFAMALITLLLINGYLGYMGKLSSKALALVVALLCSFLPANFMILFATVFMLAHIYKLSLEILAFAFAIVLLLYLLFFRFSPRDTFAVLLVPVCFLLKIPYVIPLSMGLIGTSSSMVSVACGTVVYYLIRFIHNNAAAIRAMDADGAFTRFRFIAKGFLEDKQMLVMVFAMIVCVAVVHALRRLSVDYSWSIAIGTGALSQLFVMFFGDLMVKAYFNVGGAFLSMIICTGFAFILKFFVFSVDYSHTEKVQFEDDDYYYYVKAVPKVAYKTKKTGE